MNRTDYLNRLEQLRRKHEAEVEAAEQRYRENKNVLDEIWRTSNGSRPPSQRLNYGRLTTAVNQAIQEIVGKANGERGFTKQEVSREISRFDASLARALDSTSGQASLSKAVRRAADKMNLAVEGGKRGSNQARYYLKEILEEEEANRRSDALAELREDAIEDVPF